MAPPGCVGVHFNFALVFPSPEEMAEATPHEQAMLNSAMHYQNELSGYAKEMSTRPQNDRLLPVGLSCGLGGLDLRNVPGRVRQRRRSGGAVRDGRDS